MIRLSETAGYEIRVHPRAKGELDAFHPDVEGDVKATLLEASRTRQPTSLSCIQHLKGGDGMVRVKRGDVRVICELRSPVFAVLLAGSRRTVYDRIDVATERATEVFGDA